MADNGRDQQRRPDEVRHGRDVVVVGASAGGVEALIRLFRGLPGDLQATVLVVLHMPAGGPSALPAILARHGALPTRSAGEAEPLRPSRVLVAPPDHHLVITDKGATVVRGPRENGHRPSVDVLFRTAAHHLGGRVIAVVLSGSGEDGTAGALAVRERGGLVLAQSLDDALYGVMPAAVARRVGADAVGSAEELSDLVRDAVGSPAPARAEPDALAKEAAMSENETGAVLGDPVGDPSGFACPDCNGALFVVGEEPVLRFRCRIGHAWTAGGLVEQQDVNVESALWTAVRTLAEKADLAERLAQRAKQDGRPVSANHFHEAAREARRSAAVLKQMLEASVVHAGADSEEALPDAAAFYAPSDRAEGHAL